MIGGPIIRLLLLMSNRYDCPNALDSYVTHIHRHTHKHISVSDKYATLDRISLMHSNNHKAVRLSNRNLLNGPFDQRSMVWTNDSRTNANDSDGASVCVFFLSSRLLKVLCCTLSHSLKKKTVENAVSEFNKLLKTIAVGCHYFSGQTSVITNLYCLYRLNKVDRYNHRCIT